MRLELYVDMDNAAFEDDPGAELARILRVYVESLETRAKYAGYADRVGHSAALQDRNGNTVGRAVIKQ